MRPSLSSYPGTKFAGNSSGVSRKRSSIARRNDLGSLTGARRGLRFLLSHGPTVRPPPSRRPLPIFPERVHGFGLAQVIGAELKHRLGPWLGPKFLRPLHAIVEHLHRRLHVTRCDRQARLAIRVVAPSGPRCSSGIPAPPTRPFEGSSRTRLPWPLPTRRAESPTP